MQTIYVSRVGFEAAARAVKRNTLQENPRAEAITRDILLDVRMRGDEALLELGRKFDCPTLDTLEVTAAECDAACEQVDEAARLAVKTAARNIRLFHEKQKRTSWMDATEGKVTGQVLRALHRVGVYVPGGTAVYPSSVLMSAIPAKVAGVKELFICTPCGKSGSLHPLVLYAARVAGVDRIFKVGGAQAVGAMAFGTRTIPAVEKIVGPGNVYVNIAKKQLWGVVDMDMLAGPSEVCVVADDGAKPEFAAADMLAQAEHDVECAAYLITPSEEFAKTCAKELERQIELQPRREILRKALEDHGAIVISESLEQAYELANACAPEHLALMVRDPFSALGCIHNAGAVLMGDYAPQTLGDYLAGPSHTLPTSGTARFASPLNVDTFIKKSSFIYYSSAALKEVSPTLESFAGIEGFEAHASAVRVRNEQ